MSDAQDVSLTAPEPESDIANMDTNAEVATDTNGESPASIEKEKLQQPEDESLNMPTSEMDAVSFKMLRMFRLNC